MCHLYLFLSISNVYYLLITILFLAADRTKDNIAVKSNLNVSLELLIREKLMSIKFGDRVPSADINVHKTSGHQVVGFRNTYINFKIVTF